MRGLMAVWGLAAVLAAAGWLAVTVGVGLADWAVPPMPKEVRWPSREGRLRLSHRGTLRAIQWAEEGLAAALRADAVGGSPAVEAKRRGVAAAREVEAAFRARIRAEFGKEPHELAADQGWPVSQPPRSPLGEGVASCPGVGGVADGHPPRIDPPPPAARPRHEG